MPLPSPRSLAPLPLLLVSASAFLSPLPPSSLSPPPLAARAEDPGEALRRAATGCLAAACLWSSPAFVAGWPGDVAFSNGGAAQAKEMASGSGSRVNKDPESLLRLGLPINNKEVRKMATTLEGIRLDVGSKRTSAAIEGAKNVRGFLKSKGPAMSKSCVDPSFCDGVLSSMQENMTPLDAALAEAKTFQYGSDQERKALDRAYAVQTGLEKQLTTLEEAMVPADYRTPVPPQYDDLPQLRGHATVEMVLRKVDGAPFDVEGVNFPEARLRMVIDGYNAPVTAGNFVELVQKNFYDKMAIQRSDGFVVQTGKPQGEADGYVAPPSKSVGAGRHGERLLPLEIFVKGDKGPMYETTIEDDGRGGQATTVPFSAYGAMGWAREEYDPNSGSSQFFWLLFDSDLTPGGKNVLDGRYPVFGYVVDGANFLSAVKEGDVIVSAKVTDGADRLILPKV